VAIFGNFVSLLKNLKKEKKKESATGYLLLLLLLLLLFTKRRKFTTIYFTEYEGEVKITYKIIIIVRCDLNLDPG